MAKKGWIILLVLSLAVICFSFFIFSERAILKPGCYVEEGYHYSSDGISCHCIVTNKFGYMLGLSDTPYLPVKNLRILDTDGSRCTILYDVEGMDSIIATYNYPLSNLIYSPLVVCVEPQKLLKMKLIIIIVSVIIAIISALNIDRLNRKAVKYG